MELLNFDDSLFAETKDRKTVPSLQSYNAKHCSPQWFMSEMQGDSAEIIMVYKYRAEMAYREGNYSQAHLHYKDCINKLLHSNNISMFRNVLDGCSRCLIKLGKCKEAFEMAKQVDEKAQNSDHKTSSLLLLNEVHKATGQWIECRHCLHCLLTLHPANPDLWLGLAETYISMMQDISKQQSSVPGHTCKNKSKLDTCTNTDQQIDYRSFLPSDSDPASVKEVLLADHKCTCPVLNSVCVDNNATTVATSSQDFEICNSCQCAVTKSNDNLHSSSNPQFSSIDTPQNEMYTTIDIENPAMAAVTCLLRARMLAWSVQATVHGFALEKNQRQQVQIKDQLQKLPVSECVVESCNLFFQREYGRQAEEELLNMSSNLVMTLDNTARNFNRTWFSWMEEHLTSLS